METLIRRPLPGNFLRLNESIIGTHSPVCSKAASPPSLQVWSVTSGFCFVTRSEHIPPVTAVAFMPTGSQALEEGGMRMEAVVIM